MVIRPAVLDELRKLSGLCFRSKAVWGYSRQMMAAFRKELYVRKSELSDDFVMVAEDLRGIAGVLHLSVSPPMACVEKLFVEPGRLGEGTGRLLYTWACRVALAEGASGMEIDADPGAVAFYRRMGAEPAGEAESVSIPGRMLPRLVHHFYPEDSPV